ncbi:hypothetical protein H2203_003671 [Taxawa tesnikishii (nom. ined.)]|nr:hypothetical protein H2203_003671 [Dothideales sp. JES 119]
MTTPVDERDEPAYSQPTRSSDEEGTIIGDNASTKDEHDNEKQPPRRHRQGSHLTVETAHFEPLDSMRGVASPSQTREEAHRLDDDLQMLKVERQVSAANDTHTDGGRSVHRSRSRRDDDVDEFDVATNPIHEKTAVYKPPEHPVGNFSKMVKRIHQSSFIVRYITYITPVVLILLIPLLIGALVSPATSATVGGVELVWFMIWLEIVWLTLWAGRLLAKCLPWPIGLVSSLFTNNSKKWRDMGKQLELPATLFFWWLGIEVSFLPTMTHHQADGSTGTRNWMKTMNKVLVSFFVGAILNFAEKIIIQLIAISFHLRTYADRIEINKFQIGSLTKLYTFSKEKIAMEDSEFENPSAGPGSGARTPGAYLQEAQKQTKEVINRFGDVAGKIAGDFTGRKVTKSTHPHQVILALLGTTSGSQVLARRLYRTFAREETETVHSDDLRNAFENDEEADAAFSMFDKDMNGDISMEELEAVCVEIGRERKSITASLKDLDSVVGKLDDVFMFIVALITILVFISLISTSAAGVLTSAGSTVLALSWLFSATAQEFLQSCIFVFVKHPFDVGDRVTIYGNAGDAGLGDDYFVKQISLLYTEFKKMQGHVVQAPNSYLNTLFILNQRRSGGLAEAVNITIKFGTTLEQIDGLRTKLLEFVRQEKREYQANILTELRDVVEVHSLSLNVVFFYKSNWQNEGLRLARRNKFICAMMVSMQELGIEGPRMRFPGQKESFPVYLQQIPHMATPGMGHGGHPDNPMGWQKQSDEPRDPPFVAPQGDVESSPRVGSDVGRNASILRVGSVARQRKESLSQMNRRVDFSLGMRGIASGDMAGDVFEENRPRLPIDVISPSPDGRVRQSEDRGSRDRASRKSNEIAQSTSREDNFGPGRLARRSTDTTQSRSHQSIHRNRFFGRHRAGTVDSDAHMMESGMADIPEEKFPTRRGTMADNTPNSSSPQRLDPRSGLVSPAAWRTTTGESNIHPTHPSVLGSGALDEPPEGYRRPTQTATEDFELRRLDRRM